MGYVIFVRSTCPDYSGVNCFGMQWKNQFVSRTRTTNNDLGKLNSYVILKRCMGSRCDKKKESI